MDHFLVSSALVGELDGLGGETDGDPDGDGASNADEFAAGTDPQSP